MVEYTGLSNKELKDYTAVMKGRWEEDKRDHKHKMTFKAWLLRGVHFLNYSLKTQTEIAEWYKEKSERKIISPEEIGNDITKYAKKADGN